MKCHSILVLLILLSTVALACRTVPKPASTVKMGNSQTLRIAGIDSCDDYARDVHVNPNAPLVLLVHGCNASSGRYRTLAKVFQAQGQQAICFNYDYRDSIRGTSANLNHAIAALSKEMQNPELIVVGHSQGGLVARNALVVRKDLPMVSLDKMRIRLVTVSSPFNGIDSSEHCGLIPLHFISLGMTASICHGITGDKWTEIPPRSSFIKKPRPLHSAVRDHVLIVTNEEESCRVVAKDGSCLKDDFVFTVEEQRNSKVLDDTRVKDVEIDIGHTLVVGNDGRPPFELIQRLQEIGVMNPTAPEQAMAFNFFLENVYQ